MRGNVVLVQILRDRQAQPELDIEGVQMIRKPSVVNATGDGIACAMPCMPFAEALEWTRPDVLEAAPAAEGTA